MAIGVVVMTEPAPAAAAESAALSISVPQAVHLGSGPVGATLNAKLGEVTVSNKSMVGLISGWTATVTATGFTSGSGSPAETIAASRISYTSGVATKKLSLDAAVCTPGQLDAADLSRPRTAFTCTSLVSLGSTSLSWNPTITIAVPADAIAGEYTGTITHSVA